MPENSKNAILPDVDFEDRDSPVTLALRAQFHDALVYALRNPSPELLSALAEAQFQAHVRSARSEK
jgi:hypothetical protein